MRGNIAEDRLLKADIVRGNHCMKQTVKGWYCEGGTLHETDC